VGLYPCRGRVARKWTAPALDDDVDDDDDDDDAVEQDFTGEK